MGACALGISPTPGRGDTGWGLCRPNSFSVNPQRDSVGIPVSRDTSLIARLNRQGLHYCLERPSDVNFETGVVRYTSKGQTSGASSTLF